MLFAARTAVFPLILALTGLAACTSDPAPEGQGIITNGDLTLSLNAPERLPASGNLVTFTHESGLEFTRPVVSGSVEPPVLWDGRWLMRSDNGFSHDLIVGGANSGSLRSCMNNDKTSSRAAVRCAQALMTSTGLSDGYVIGAEIMGETLAAGRDDPLWGKYCHLSGFTLATAAVLAGEDPRDLMSTQEPPCEYSTFHGAGAGVALMTHGDPTAAVRACAPNPDSDRAEFSQGTQCWHGIGIGLAFLNRFNPEPGIDTCTQAPDPAWAGNCIEGMFAAYREYLKRLEPGEWETANAPIERCRVLYATNKIEALANACYQDFALRSYDRHRRATTGEFANLLGDEIELFISACQSSADAVEHRACWEGLANQVAAAVLLSVGQDRETAQRWITICDEGGSRTNDCYRRMALALYQSPQRPTGLPLEEVLELLPFSQRESARRAVSDWLAQNYDNNQSE